MSDGNPSTTALLDIRERIDSLDTQILELLSERAKCAEKVGEVKRAAGETDICFYRPEREAQILRRMVALNKGPLRDEQITRIYRSIISSCLGLEQCLSVAYLGPEGTYTQAATQKHFGDGVKMLPLASLSQVFREVEAGTVNYGVVPIENSTEGVISHTLDLFVQSTLKICGEIHLPIHHSLMCHSAELHFDDVKTVYAHQQALGQCRQWLDANLPNANRVAVSSNAEGARMTKSEPDAVAIAGQVAAELYKLHTLQENIEDNVNNTTRFLVIGHHDVTPSGNDKTTLLISAHNKSGALYHLLEPLSKHALDMTRIESRPSKNTNWEYLFFMDIAGHAEDENVKSALLELEQEAELFRILGSYPTAIL
ncbi:MAG: prephenate dehydratase [Aquificaceae bacterium]|nr:MAG: prephenate dehydratase [Aquificaceae bacterium]